MIFAITQSGLLAANNAQAGGPKITITTFKVGSGVNYTPTISDTALHGTVLYTQPTNGYTVLSANEVEYTLILDDAVGNFSFGEVGLYMDDGTLFALSALSELQLKKKTEATDAGNIVSFEARLMLTQIAANISFPINQMPNAKVLELPSVDLLRPPSISDTNAYITLSKDSSGSGIPAMKSGDFEWSFSSFATIFSGVVSGNGSGYTTATVQLVGGTSGTPATATATLAGGSVVNIVRAGWGSGYTVAPTVVITGDGAGAEASATITTGVVAIGVLNSGSSYTSAPTVVITGGSGTGASAVATISAGQVTNIIVTNPGKGYTGSPSITLSGGGGAGATASATTSGILDAVKVSTNSNNSLMCSTLNNAAAAVVPGKYILQWISGSLAGYARMVVSSTTSGLVWATTSPTGTPPISGDKFVLYQSLSSVIDDMKGQLNNGSGAKAPVRFLLDAPSLGVGLPIIDGVQSKEGDRVLRIAQANGAENGVFMASLGVWTRALDFNTSKVVTPACLVPVSEGAKWKDSVWQLTTNDPIALGTTPLVFRPANEAWIKRTASSISLITTLSLG